MQKPEESVRYYYYRNSGGKKKREKKKQGQMNRERRLYYELEAKTGGGAGVKCGQRPCYDSKYGCAQWVIAIAGQWYVRRRRKHRIRHIASVNTVFIDGNAWTRCNPLVRICAHQGEGGGGGGRESVLSGQLEMHTCALMHTYIPVHPCMRASSVPVLIHTRHQIPPSLDPRLH